MARRATGTIETHPWRDGRTVTVRARLRAYGGRYCDARGGGWPLAGDAPTFRLEGSFNGRSRARRPHDST
jgi:hypothetical protein